MWCGAAEGKAECAVNLQIKPNYSTCTQISAQCKYAGTHGGGLTTA